MCCNGCWFFPAVMLTWLRLLLRTMRRPCGGLNAEALRPVPRRWPRRWRRQLAGWHPLKRPQGVRQKRRELRPVCVGFRPRHRQRRTQDINRGRRFRIGEDQRSLLPHGWPFPCGATARAPPPRAGLEPCFRRLLLGGSVDSPEDGQQRVEGSLRQAGQGFHLTFVSDVQPHR